MMYLLQITEPKTSRQTS